MKTVSGRLNQIASVLAMFTAAIHVFVGGADALTPMLAAEMTVEASGAMHACWHFVSIFLLVSAVTFWQGGRTASVFALLWISFAVVFVYVGLYQAGIGGLIANPQWTILLATGVVALFGARANV